MIEAISRIQLAYDACGRRRKYSTNRIGRKRKRKVGSVNSTQRL
jgi:hypothetical protein